jgi:hypothetical protein
MKTFISRSKIIALAFVVTFSLASAKTFATYKNDTPVQLVYLGNVNNQPVFQLVLNNDETTSYVVTLRDASGDVLYSEEIKGKQFPRKYRVNTDEAGVSGIRFEVKNKKDNTKTTYTVSATSHVVQDVAISKL